MAGLFDVFKPGAEEKAHAEVLAKAQTALNHARAVAADQSQPVQERLLAAHAAKVFEERIKTNPLTMRADNKTFVEGKQSRALEGLGFIPAGHAPPGGGLSFDAGPTPALDMGQIGKTPAPPPAPNAANVQGDTLTRIAAVLGTQPIVTSGFRDPAKNASVGGVNSSDHTKTDPRGDPLAYDILPPKGKTAAETAKILAAAGFGTIADADGHVHVSTGAKQVSRGALFEDANKMFTTLAPTIARGDPLDAGGVQVVDPRAMMAMLPKPRMVPKIDLPNAPQQELPSNMPAMAMLDKAAMLAPVETAIMPKPRDGKEDTWDRFRALLQGAGQGAATADPTQGLGNFILRAGTGAGAGFTKEKDKQKDEIKAYDESVRVARTALAKMGFELDMKNFETGNLNLDRAWKSKENQREVKFSNAQLKDSRNVAEILQNAGITAQNIGALNVADERKANVAIRGMEAVAAGQNTANRTQAELNMAESRNAAASDKKDPGGTDAMLIAHGFDPGDTKNVLIPVAKATAAAVKAKNPEAALAGVAHEIVLSGHAGDVLGDADAKAVTRAIQQKNIEGAAQIVTNALVANMKSKPADVLALIDQLAAQGLPSATLISKSRKRDATVAAK